MNYMFSWCEQLTSLNVSNFNLENAISVSGMFQCCFNLKSIKLFYNTQTIENMNSLFRHCYSLLSIDLSKFDTSNVKDMAYMFYECKVLTSIDLSNFITNDNTIINYMFYYCYNLQFLNFSSFKGNYINYTNLFYKNSDIACRIIVNENSPQNIRNIIPDNWIVEP